MDGEHYLRVVINETVEPTAYQIDNIETAAKSKGKDGEFITHKGKYIFSNTSIEWVKADSSEEASKLAKEMFVLLTPDTKSDIPVSNATAFKKAEFTASDLTEA